MIQASVILLFENWHVVYVGVGVGDDITDDTLENLRYEVMKRLKNNLSVSLSWTSGTLRTDVNGTETQTAHERCPIAYYLLIY